METENLDDFCKNQNLNFDNVPTKINNYADFTKYLQKINKKAKNISIDYDTYEKEQCKFIPIFDENVKFCFETISGTIKHTKKLKIKNESGNIIDSINNVFILNKDKDKYCYEIKLGHGSWDNLTQNKNDFNMFNNENNNCNIFKIGLLKIKGNCLNKLDNNLIYRGKIIKSNKCDNYEVKYLRNFNKEKIIENYKYFKDNIYYSYDLNNIVKKTNDDVNNKKIKPPIETIHKNDVIGVSVDKNSMSGYIKFKIFINGELIHYKLIPNIVEENTENYSNIDDEYDENEIKDFLISFIELGPNNSFFIKDKPNNNKIISNEKMSYYDSYNIISLNDFPQNIEETQNLADFYFDMMNKVGNKLINSFPNILDKGEDQNLPYFFINIIFKNKIILKNKFLYYLCYDFTPNDMTSFKDKLKAFFLIIYKNTDTYNKIGLIKLFINLLIELISEKNFNLIDSIKISYNSEKLMIESIRLKFVLCFILFDVFMKENYFIDFFFKSIEISLFEDYEFFINFFLSLFNNILYVEPLNIYNLLKEKRFYVNNIFNKNKFILFNFKFSKDKSNSLSENVIQYYEFIVENIFINQLLFNKDKYDNLFQFALINYKLNDNFSLINGIFRSLIHYFKIKNKDYLNNIGKFIYSNYIESENKIINLTNNLFKEKDTFFGKVQNNNSVPEIFKKFKNSLFFGITQEEKNIFLIYRIVLIYISKYYNKFSNLETKVNNFIDNYNINNKDNNKINLTYELSQNIEFCQIFLSYHTYDELLFYFYFLSEILNFSMKNKEILNYLPYKEYLNNILFTLDILNIRCKVIDDTNLINAQEPGLISYIIRNILKLNLFFLGQEIQKINQKNFINKTKYEENIYLHIIIFIKILYFDGNIIKDIIPEIKSNLILAIKNLYELSIIKENKIINKGINKLIENLYSFGITDEHYSKIDFSVKENLFIHIMKEENKNYKPIDEEKNSTHHNNIIKNTLYYHLFIIIYNKIKIIRNSLIKILEKNENENVKIFLIKLTYALNLLYNFFIENELFMCYDIHCILFFKINSFICKTFKQLFTDYKFEQIFNLRNVTTKENDKNDIVLQFFTQLFKVISVIIYNKEYYKSNYYKNFLYEIAKNRKGFHFKEIKNNINKYFKDNKNYKDIIDLLNKKLSVFFEAICKEEDVLDENEVNDNSIEIESRMVCAICQMDEPELDAHLKDCNHEFHMDCIKQLIKSDSSCSGKCPLCKRVITGIKEEPYFIINSQKNEINLDIDHFNNINFINSRNNYNNRNNSSFRYIFIDDDDDEIL